LKQKNSVAFGTVVLTHVTNPFAPSDSKKVRTDLHGHKLHKYLEGFCLGQEYLVVLNGKEQEDFEYVVQPNDNIIYTPIVSGGGGGGKGIVRLVALVALSIYAPYLTANILGYTGIAASATGFYALQLGVMVAGSMLINAVIPPTSATITGGVPETQSPSYSWTGSRTNRNLNVPIPVLYGTFGLGGTVINNKFYYQGDDDWLATQIALCYGEIEAVNPEDVFINKVEFSSFYNTASAGYFKYLNGQFDQPVMTGFDDTRFNNGAVAKRVEYNDPYTFTSQSTAIDDFKLHFEFPKGLFHMTQEGKVQNKSVNFNVEYREVGAPTWENIYALKYIYTTEYEFELIPVDSGDGGFEGDGDYGFGDDDNGGGVGGDGGAGTGASGGPTG